MKSSSLGIRLTIEQERQIDVLIDGGVYLSKGEFIREAVREKLQSVDVLQVRDVSRAQATREILDYLSTNGRAWTSDISAALELDLDLVMSILKELRTAGKVVPDDRA